VVGLLDSGHPGKTLAFRADMDALPIQESTEVAYPSCHPGIMHACGHDGHVATLLLVARVLQQIKPQLRGKIKLIFQPAEEGGRGSSAMIEAGVLENPHVDAIFAFHSWPGLPLNTLATRSGCILAGDGRFEMTLHGKRAHIAFPKKGINPVIIGAGIIKEIEALSLPKTVVNLLGFNSGDWQQGTSERAELVGVYFVEGEQELREVKERIQAITPPFGTVAFHDFHAPTVNSLKETEQVFSAAKAAGLQEIVLLPECKMVGEDFSEYLSRLPGCYFLIGAGEKTPSLHTSFFDFPDAILLNAAHVMVQLALKCF
ncbi:MAG: amidohydrolase, partial [Verrucomicrobia bacterium]|nr:amidohydrolase [Verrucomicrobiota bacterium]